MDDTAVQRALDRIAVSRESRADPAALEAVLIRARAQVESLAASTAVMQVGLPGAIQDGLREHFKPSARHLAEVRGLMNQMLRRMERLETDLLAERNARIDDLALLVDLIASSWRSANERLERIEAAVEPKAGNSAVVYRIERPDQQAS
jgi:hypothetical protein